MKFLKGLLVVVLLVAVVAITNKTVKNLKKPASGPVDIEMTDTIAPVEEAPVVVAEEPVEVAPEVTEPVFIPIQFNKLKDLKKMGGVKVKLSPVLGGRGKGYRIGDDVYFENKEGVLLVFHGGKVIVIK